MRPGDLIIFIAPFLTLVSWLMCLLSSLGPQPFHRLSLFTLVPNPTNKTNLPTITIGLFGSCVRTNSNLDCARRFFGDYNLDVLPDPATRDILIPPHPAFSIVIIIANIFTFLFLCTWCIFVDFLPINTRYFEFTFEYIPLVAFATGVVPFSIVHMFFCHIRDYFNDYHEQLGRVDFIASTGDGFDFVWASYKMIFAAMIILWLHAFKQNPFRTRYGSPLSHFRRKHVFDRLIVNAEGVWENPVFELDVLRWGVLTRPWINAHRGALAECGVNTARRTAQLMTGNQNFVFDPAILTNLTDSMELSVHSFPRYHTPVAMLHHYLQIIRCASVSCATQTARHLSIPDHEVHLWREAAERIVLGEMRVALGMP